MGDDDDVASPTPPQTSERTLVRSPGTHRRMLRSAVIRIQKEKENEIEKKQRMIDQSKEAIDCLVKNWKDDRLR